MENKKKGMAFIRPGTISSKSFGISYDTDRDQDNLSFINYNKNIRLNIIEQRKRLPVYSCRLHFLYTVETRAVTIVIGETGSGKSTQLGQYLLEANWTEGGKCIVCTQPRRVAAISLATRVAEERGTSVGEDVGYAIRFEDVSTVDKTMLKFMTDGVLLREMLDDPLLNKYSVIIVDEAHERSIQSDILLCLLRKVILKRPELRLVISSATIEANKLKEFFDSRTSLKSEEQVFKEPYILRIPGRVFPVQIHYLKHSTADYVKKAVETSLDIHKENIPGDILVFLTGQDECNTAVKMVKDYVESRKKRKEKYVLSPLPLYSGLTHHQQMEALRPSQRGIRKVIFSTNVAETSLTIDGIVFVIDSLFVKAKNYNPYNGLDSLHTTVISKASATQRAGRAGRVMPGHCFRLCKEEVYEKELLETTIPEIQRSDLTSTVLLLKSFGIENLVKFRWIDSPSAEAIIKALEHLHVLGAIDEDAQLTRPVGYMMTELSLDPILSKCVIESSEMGCSTEMILIASLLSVKSVWIVKRGHFKALERAKDKFSVREGDLITYLNVYHAWEQNNKSERWCHDNCINHKAMVRTEDVKKQLEYRFKQLGLKMVSCGTNLTPLLKCITSGLCMSVAVLQDEVTDIGSSIYKLIRDIGDEDQAKLRIHASSILRGGSPMCVVFYSVEQNDIGYYDMSDVTEIKLDWLIELLPHLYMKQDN